MILKSAKEANSGSQFPASTDSLNGTPCFARMFRPHALREDTVIFPTLRALLTPAQYIELSAEIENLEAKMGTHNELPQFVRVLDGVEKMLAINDLAKFTAVLPSSSGHA